MSEIPNTAKASKKRHEELIVENTRKEALDKKRQINKHKKLKEQYVVASGMEAVVEETNLKNKNLIYPTIREKKIKDREDRLSADKLKQEEDKVKRKAELIELKAKVKEQKEKVKEYKDQEEAKRVKLEEEQTQAKKIYEEKQKIKRDKEIEERKLRSQDTLDDSENQMIQ